VNVPEPKKLSNREEVEKHFRETHLANIIRTVEAHTLNGAAAQQLPAEPLRQLLRRAWDEQQRFPLKVVTTLSQQFAASGLQFFKVNKTITHVAVARPHYLDMEATPVSEGVQRIVDYINGNSGCTRRQLIEALAPTPVQAVAPTSSGPAETTDATGETAEPPAPATTTAAMTAGETPAPTPEQTAVIADLHWLIHQGHVLEFANGRIETAKKPNPRPPKPEAKPADAGSESVSPVEGIAGPPPTGNATTDSQTGVASETASPSVEPEPRPALSGASSGDAGVETPIPGTTASEPTNEATSATT